MASKKVAIIGFTPETVDFSGTDKVLSPEFIRHGVSKNVQEFQEKGIQAKNYYIDANDMASLDGIMEEFKADDNGVIVLGGGLRFWKYYLYLEKAINLLKEQTPLAKIALNDGPDKSVEAAMRYL